MSYQSEHRKEIEELFSMNHTLVFDKDNNEQEMIDYIEFCDYITKLEKRKLRKKKISLILDEDL